jgi:hypothetical protein
MFHMVHLPCPSLLHGLHHPCCTAFQRSYPPPPPLNKAYFYRLCLAQVGYLRIHVHMCMPRWPGMAVAYLLPYVFV